MRMCNLKRDLEVDPELMDQRPSKQLTSPRERAEHTKSQVYGAGKRILAMEGLALVDEEEMDLQVDCNVSATKTSLFWNEKKEDEEGGLEISHVTKEKERIRVLIDNLSNVAVRVDGYGIVRAAGRQTRSSSETNSFASYRVRVSVFERNNKTDERTERIWYVFRRFSAFLFLVKRMHELSTSFVQHIPALPEKSIKQNVFEESFLSKRADELHQWIRAIVFLWKTLPEGSAENGVRSVLSEFFCEDANHFPLADQDSFVPVQLGDLLAAAEGTNVRIEDVQNFDPNLSPRTALANICKKSQSLSDYSLLKVVGKGSFGQVFLAESKSKLVPLGSSSKDYFAIKVLGKAEMIRRKQSSRVEIERLCMDLCKCPFIVGLHGAYATDSHLFLVQDFCEAGEMYFHLDQKGKFSTKLARFYAAECAIALAHLHKHAIVYRDLKPENIMITRSGHIKLVDFGLAKHGIRDPLKGALSFVGTMEYLSPEMIRKSGHGFAVDYWSLGMVLFEMLTGLPPWYCEDRKIVWNGILNLNIDFPPGQVPSSARSLLRGLLKKDAAERLGSKSGLAELEAHPFFTPLDFAKLEAHRIRPPSVPELEHAADTCLFDEQFTSLPPKVEVHSKNPHEDKALIRNAETQGLFKSFRKVSFPHDFVL